VLARAIESDIEVDGGPREEDCDRRVVANDDIYATRASLIIERGNTNALSPRGVKLYARIASVSILHLTAILSYLLRNTNGKCVA